MKFSDKYISVSEKEKDKESKKQVISDESFAICEMLNEICFRISRMK